jgi:peroxiredoxin/sRNA-binding regulator protein Hfq
MYKIAISIFFAFLIVACQPKEKPFEGFIIEGHITGCDSTVVYLKRLNQNQLIALDSVRVLHGLFKLQGLVKMPEKYYLFFGDNQKKVAIFLENSTIHLKANFDSLSNAKISGSKSHDEYKAYRDEILPFENKMSDFQQQLKTSIEQGNATLASQLDSILLNLESEMLRFIKDYVVTHKSSAVAPYILHRISLGMEYDELDEMLSILDNSLDSSVYTIELREKRNILKSIGIGMIAPDFGLPDKDGNIRTLSSLRGKYVLIYFWASWCVPCRRENPGIVAIYREFNPKGLELIGISLDNDKTSWEKAISNDKLPGAQVSDLKFWDSEPAKSYGIGQLPKLLLIDKKGIIIASSQNIDTLKLTLSDIVK